MASTTTDEKKVTPQSVAAPAGKAVEPYPRRALNIQQFEPLIVSDEKLQVRGEPIEPPLS
jgi:hypothetical protein